MAQAFEAQGEQIARDEMERQDAEEAAEGFVEFEVELPIGGNKGGKAN